VQAVGKLDHHNANVLHHGQQHLANVFRLARFRRHHVQAADFGDTFDKLSHLASKAFLETRKGKLGVFNDVVEQGRRERGGVHADIGQNVGHFQEMRDVGIARSAETGRGGVQRRFRTRAAPARGLPKAGWFSAFREALPGGR